MKRLIAIALLASAPMAQAEQQLTEEEKLVALSVFATCAATNALLAGQMEPPLKEVMEAEAFRFRDLIEPAYQSTIATAITNLSAAYNTGEMSWHELVEIGQLCSTIQ